METSQKLDLASSKVSSLGTAIVDGAIWVERQSDLLLLLTFLTLLARRGCSRSAS